MCGWVKTHPYIHPGNFPAYARLPYTAGPGMPGPYRIFLLPSPLRGGFFHFYVNFTRSPLARRINILYN